MSGLSKGSAHGTITALEDGKSGDNIASQVSPHNTMKRNLLVLSLSVLAFTLPSCVAPSSTARQVSYRPATTTYRPAYVTRTTEVRNGALYGSLTDNSNPYTRHHYDPSLYTPYSHDHRGSDHQVHYLRREAWEAGRTGTVEVGTIRAN